MGHTKGYPRGRPGRVALRDRRGTTSRRRQRSKLAAVERRANEHRVRTGHDVRRPRE